MPCGAGSASPSFPKAPVWAAMSANRLPRTVACHRIRRHRSVGSEVDPLFNNRRRVQADRFGGSQVCIPAISAKSRRQLGHGVSTFAVCFVSPSCALSAAA